jgi:CBS domain-containing protein
VKKLRLSKALTIPEATTVSEACRRMATRRVDAVLLTDAHGLLSGIVTDKVSFFFIFLIFWRNLIVTMSPRALL